ncbi:MAG: rhodanese-like domain-containing protein [Gammaproteobacteria bacterium]
MATSNVKTISAKQAHQIILDNPKALMIDVRSHMEFLFIGHPTGAINIAWIDEPDWIINPRFVAEIRQTILGGMSHIDSIESAPLILICRSGKRSLEAGELLVKEGFHNIYNVDEGFEGELNDEHKRSSLAGWRYDKLPWEQC